MVQQTIDSKFSEYGLGTTGLELPIHDKQFSVPIKKTALKDLNNDKNIAMPHSNSIENSSLTKDREPVSSPPIVLGTKRPLLECPPKDQSLSRSAANGHLVYVRQVRRKTEADVVRSSTYDNGSINADCQVSRKLSHQEASTRPMPQTQEPKVYCVPAFAPFPMAGSTIPSGKPSVTAPHCMPGIRVAPSRSNCNPLDSASPTLPGSKGLQNLHWEERYHHLQLLLRQFDQSEQEDYLQVLRSLSSVDLSRHAVELEKRSIQLSLEEAKELQRVGILNVLGKAAKHFKMPAMNQDRLPIHQ